MKTCEQCGHTYPANYAICPKCHHSSAPADSKPQTIAKRRDLTAFLKDFWGIAAILIWIIGGGLSIFFLIFSLTSETVDFWATLGGVVNLLILTFLLGFAAYTLSHILEKLKSK